MLLSTATLRAIDLSGTWKTSQFRDGLELTLTGATTLIVDVPKSLKNIYGDFPLTIQGSKKLTISSGAHGISVSSVNISTDVEITSKKDGLNIDRDIVIDGGNVNIDAKKDGIYSRHGSITIKNSHTTSACGTNCTAIVSKEGNITFGDNSTVEAFGAKQAIDASAGNLISSGNVTAYASGWAVWARTVTVNGGKILAKSAAYALTASAGDVVINGDVEAISTYNDCNGLQAKGSVIIKGGNVVAECGTSGTAVDAGNNIQVEGGSLTAHGAKYGIYAKNRISIASDVTVTGFWAMWAQKIEINSPYHILTPLNGHINDAGTTIVNDGNNWANYVVVGTWPLKGSVSIDNDSPIPGTYLRYKLGGEVFQLNANGETVNAVWQQSSDGETGWNDISTTTPYIVKDKDYDTYLRVRIDVPGYVGYLYSGVRKVTKAKCYVDVVDPQLIISGDKLYVANAKNTQEYIILTTMKLPTVLTENDWANSKKPDSNGYLDMGGTKETTNYVYTRVRGNGWMFAGTDVRFKSIYYGETTYTKDFQLTVKKVNGISSPTSESYLEEDNGYYYASVSTNSDRLRLTATPIPENATNFNGIRGDMWLMNGYSIGGSQYGMNGRLYEDFQCTREINPDTYYKSVYVKLTRQSNNVQIAAQYTRGYNDMAYHSIYFFVGDADGNVLINSMGLTGGYTTIARGDVMKGLQMSIYPRKATVKTLTTTTTDASSPGTAPIISFDTDQLTMTVDATNADNGTYFYNIYNNHVEVGHFQVKVVDTPVEEVHIVPEKLSVDPGKQYELAAQLIPSNADGKLAWWSSNTSVATVSSNGVVTIKEDAPIGAKATITASLDGKTGSCEITVDGEKFELYVAGIQVTTQNMGNLAELIAERSDESMNRYLEGDMEVWFDGVRTLTLKNATIYTGDYEAQGMTLGIEGLIVEVQGDCRVNSNNYHGIKLKSNATITGNGTLTLTGGNCGIRFQDSSDYPVTLSVENTSMNITGYSYGIHGGNTDYSNRLDIDNANVYASGIQGAVASWTGGIDLTDCAIVEPEGASISDGNILKDGSLALSVLIKASGKKGDVNRDGEVNISDVVAVINTLAGNTTFKATADVNGDNSINISDIVAIINIIAGGK